MRINLKMMLIACIALSMGFASCSSNDEPDVTGNKKDNGEPTYVTLALSFPKSETSQLRATNDPVATEAEAKINTVDVFIYTADGGHFLSHKHLSATDFTQSDGLDKYVLKSTTKIETTTGERRVFVGVNLPSKLINILTNQNNGANEWTQKVQTLTGSDLVYPDSEGDNNIVMTSATTITHTFVVDETQNSLEIPVKRAVAKLTVQMGRPMIQEGVPGKLGSLSFAINNFNERSFLVQPADKKDSNWAIGSYVAGEFSQASANDYILVNDSLITDVKQLKALYAAENTSEGHTKREITRVTIRATFIPTNETVLNAGNYVEAPSGKTAPETFYTVTVYNPNPEIKCFYSKDTADAYKAKVSSDGITSSEVVTYANGLCYWDLFPNKNVWDVIRNDFYRSTISRIIVPGRSTPTIPDDELPNVPSSETDITITVDVIPWDEVFWDDYVLEP
ncbi:MAG: Mfa1 family fimbria major subunit [Candidatus Symbiothrix sp.]|jgi:hypothetical protein|nr:Mfa1 family fimbria major subunit [Candidatus Symbiothrix sp.]